MLSITIEPTLQLYSEEEIHITTPFKVPIDIRKCMYTTRAVLGGV